MFNLIKIYEKRIWGGIILFLISLNFVLWSLVLDAASKPDLKIHFFDIGQGDSILIESKDGTQILLDGGPANKILPKLGAELPYFDRSIDAVVVSHPHADHISGLIEVLKNYEVGMIIESGVLYHTPEYFEFQRLVNEKNIKKIFIDRELSLNFLERDEPANTARLRFVYPNKSYAGQTIKNVHDASLVAMLEYQGRKVLFMGDAEKNVERALIRAGKIEDVDVLKAGHSGSKTSTTKELLEAARPEYAIISVGKNSYGHPHAEVVERLTASAIQTFRTDRDGTITLEIRNGELIWK